MAKQPTLKVSVDGATQAVGAVLSLHRPAQRHHESHNHEGTLIAYRVTDDGPCITCYPDWSPTHCEDCDDESCTGNGNWARQAWPCATYTAVMAALKEE